MLWTILIHFLCSLCLIIFCAVNNAVTIYRLYIKRAHIPVLEESREVEGGTLIYAEWIDVTLGRVCRFTVLGTLTIKNKTIFTLFGCVLKWSEETLGTLVYRVAESNRKPLDDWRNVTFGLSWLWTLGVSIRQCRAFRTWGCGGWTEIVREKSCEMRFCFLLLTQSPSICGRILNLH